MSRKFKTQLVGQLGEYLVVAELARRGVIATPFSGNVPDIDVLAYHPNGKSVAIQVKASTRGKISVDAKKYIEIEFDGDKQNVIGKKEDIDRDLVFVLVRVGDNLGEDRFFIYEQGLVQDIILRTHTQFLAKHGGVRPRNPESTHSGYELLDLAACEGNWNLILERLS